MKYSKKAQFAVFSGLFLFLLLFFIYSSETQNTYILKNGEFLIDQNIKNEVCSILKSSNGTQINSTIPLMESDVSLYCTNKHYDCSLNFVNTTQIPPSGNWSLLNYTHYYMDLNITSKYYLKQLNFTC